MREQSQQPASRPTGGARAAVLVALGILLGAQSNPAEAWAQAGSMVVIREVPDRHAFLPGAGKAVAVQLKPGLSFFGAGSPARILTDGESASVRADRPAAGPGDPWQGPGLQPPGPKAQAQQGIRTAGGAGFGARIGSAVEKGMGAVKGVLQRVPGLGE